MPSLVARNKACKGHKVSSELYRGAACNDFEPGMATGSEHFAGQDIGLSPIFKPIVFTSAKRFKNINVVVSRPVK